MKCTWVDCRLDAAHPQVAEDGEQWANLCEDHNKELEESLDLAVSGNIKKMISSWIKAQGGSKKAAARMMR